jgi:uncharacterized protein with HEPN domain
LRRDRLYLLDILNACKKIERYLSKKTYDDFANDEVLFDATVRNLQNIGEAVRFISEDLRELRPDIEWRRIVGLRNLLVHHYFGLDEEIVWDLAVNRCPQLQHAISDILGRLTSE